MQANTNKNVGVRAYLYACVHAYILVGKHNYVHVDRKVNLRTSIVYTSASICE